MSFSGQGFIGGVNDILFGNDARENRERVFTESDLGASLQEFLLNRLNTPVRDSKAFNAAEGEIIDAGDSVMAAAAQRRADAGVDAGASVALGESQERAELGTFASNIRNLILQLEDQKDDDILPFLSGAAEENTSQRRIDIGLRQQDADIHDTRFDNIMNLVSSIMGLPQDNEGDGGQGDTVTGASGTDYSVNSYPSGLGSL